MNKKNFKCALGIWDTIKKKKKKTVSSLLERERENQTTIYSEKENLWRTHNSALDRQKRGRVAINWN